MLNQYHIKDNIATVGRANIEKGHQTQLAKIEKNKQKQLAALNLKFSTADLAKASFGYIAFMSLGILFGSILLNDLFNLIKYCNPRNLFKDKRIYNIEKQVREITL